MTILPLAYHVYQLNTRQYGLGPTERFESRHQSYLSFDVPVILLHKVVQIFVLPDCDTFFIGFAGIECGQRCRIGTTFINGHHLRFTMVADGLAEETQGGCRITLRRQQEIYSLTVSIPALVSHTF